MASTQITDLHGVPYDFDADRRAMGVSVADDVDMRQPGGSGAPQTEYRPSAGHKPLPAREVARRRMVQVDAASSEALDDDMNRQLATAIGPEDWPDRDRRMAARERAHGIAVGAHCRAADPYAGYLGGSAGDPVSGYRAGVRLQGSQAQLRHLFGVE